jgi:PPOX class probable F420-dependent enzyme
VRPYDAQVSIDDLASGKYISLATYKREGTRIATPVWVTRDGDFLYVITDPASGKAKRLRNSSRAQVAPCDARGTVSGEVVDAVAVLLDEAGTHHVQSLVMAKYGLLARAFTVLGKIRRNQRVGIKITVG